MAPWVRAPFLLLRRGGVAAALIAAAFVAALPAATAAPFLSSSANATLHSQIAATCPANVGDAITYDMHIYADTDYQTPWPEFGGPSVSEAIKSDMAIEQRITDVAQARGGLSSPEVVWYSRSAHAEMGGQSVTVLSVTVPNFAQHVRVLSGPSGAGVWVPDGTAAAYHVKVGDPVVYTSPYGAPVNTRVAAVYQDLRADPTNPAFCAMHNLIFGPRGAQLSDSAVGIPPVILMDRQLFSSGGIPYRAKTLINFALNNPKVPFEQASNVLATINAVNATTAAAFHDCLGCQNSLSELRAFTTRAQLARAGIRPTVLPITAAGVLVGLVVVAAAAVFWVLRRRRELTVLSAHGMGAASLGVKAILEATPALVVGAALAWAGGSWLVRTAGPDPHISHASTVDALWAALAALVAAMIVVGAAAGLRCRTLTDERRTHHRLRLALWPWELIIIAGGVFAAIGFGSATVTRDAPGGDGGLVVQVPPKLLIVPLLLAVGCLTLLGRITVVALRSRRKSVPNGRGSSNGSALVLTEQAPSAHSAGRQDREREPAVRRRSRPMVWFLGWRRLAREAAVVAVLGGATALPIALATYGDAVTRSVQATVDGEAQLLVGTDVVVTLSRQMPVPAVFGDNATEVLHLAGVTIGDNSVDLYAVDPTKFTNVAFWNGQIEGRSLASILAPLRAPHQPGTPYPAVTSAAVQSGVQAPEWGFATTTKYDVTTVTTLPAEQGGYKSLITTPESLGAEAAYASPQLWIRGDPATIRAELVNLRLPTVSVSSVDAVYSNTVFQPLTYTFEYLTALSILTGVVTIVGLLLYVEAQAPSHRRGYVMARRMGLRSRTHRRALLVELAMPLVAGLAIGLGVALGLTYAFSAGFDVDPSLPPRTLIDLPVLVISGIGIAVAVVAMLASGFAQLRVSRANPSEVLRDTV